MRESVDEQMERRRTTRDATAAEIAAFKSGEQKLWRCPDCGHETEVLSAVMVFCAPCGDERKRLVPMRRVEGTER